MKKLDLFTQYGKIFTYIADEALSIGIYKTIRTEHLNENDKILLTNHNITYDKFCRISDAVLVKTKAKDMSRIDFLITEDICFESLELISEHGFDGQYFDEFTEAFDMLETEQYDDDIWYH